MKRYYSDTTDKDELIRVAFDKQAATERRIFAIIDLSYPDDAELAHRFLSILADPTEPPEIRGEVCDKFSDQWDARAVPVLHDALRDESLEVRFWAAYAVYTAYFHIPYRAKEVLLPVLDGLVASDEVLSDWWQLGREALPALESIHYAKITQKNRFDATIQTVLLSPKAEYWTFSHQPDAAPLTTDLSIDSDWLAQQLKRRWLNLKLHVRRPRVQSYLLDWQIGTGKHKLIGALHRDGFGIVLTGLDQRLITRFAAWYRTLIPQRYPL
jgi:hypothetical protein